MTSNNEKTNTKNSSDLYKKISEIDNIIDKIILKNKEKLERIKANGFNIEKFSIKNKKGDTLYYVRKKQNKKSDEEKESDILSKKIITEARENLGEEPLEEKEDVDEFDKTYTEDGEVRIKKRIKIGKKIDKIEDLDNTPTTASEVLESEELNEIISKIDNVIEEKSSEETEKEKEIIDEKIKENTGSNDDTEEDYAKAKAEKLVEAHEFFSEENIEKTKEKKEIDWLSTSTDNLAELKKKYGQNIEINEVDSKTIELANDEELKLIDDKIKEDIPQKDGEEIKKSEEKSFLDTKTAEEKKPVDNAIEQNKQDKIDIKAVELAQEHLKDSKQNLEIKKEGLGTSKPKKPFFMRKKPSKQTDFELKKEVTEPAKSTNEPKFRVDNIPQEGDDEKEKELMDKNIKNSARIVDITGDGKIGEEAAVKLAEEHLKNRPKNIESPKPSIENEAKKESKLKPVVPIGDKDTDREHVFFDEEESSSGGWSPQVTEKEKRKMSTPIPPQGEVDLEDIKPGGDVELPKEVLQTKSVKLTDLGFSEKEWEELDFYSLLEPFAYVEILREKESLDKCYFLVEIALTEEEEKVLGFIKDTLASVDIDTLELEEKSDEQYLLERLDIIIEEYNIEISEETKNKIFYYIGKTSLGLDKIDPLMKDPNIEDISCDGSDVPLFLYHRKYGSLKSNVRFEGEEELASFVFKLAQKCGKHVSIAEPMLDATMPDGSRIQMTLSDEITAKGSTFTIRKFRSDPFSPPDLAEFNTMSPEIIAYMWIAVENGINTLFAGGTASGKTTALNALALFIPRESKIVSIEETREINLPHPNWIPGVARSGFGEVVADKVVGEIDLYDLMKAALRQRPEYILVGEIRGREAYVLFQAMATGHATYSTAHADSAQSLIHRLEGKPINIPRIMLQSLDIVCLHVITRVKNIRARRCKQVIEIIDIDPTTKEILTNEVFRWDPVEDKFIYSGKSYVLERIRAEKDFSREEMTNEIKNRTSIIEWMNTNNIRAFKDVANLVAQYVEDPEVVLTKVKKGAKK